MSELGAVIGGLGSMSQLQLLLAFVTCSAYALAIGNLLPTRGQRVAWGVAGAAAVGFTCQSDDWTHATILVGFAVAGLAAFVALAWLTSRVIRVDTAATLPESGYGADSAVFETTPVPLAGSPRTRSQATGPAHFV